MLVLYDEADDFDDDETEIDMIAEIVMLHIIDDEEEDDVCLSVAIEEIDANE